MSVRCDGDSRVMQQLGEKQDFESELSRLGFAHEDFMLHVRRERSSIASTWAAAYSVCVTHTPTRRQRIYQGGAGRHWLQEFVADLKCGLRGEPRFGVAAQTLANSASVRFGAPAKSY